MTLGLTNWLGVVVVATTLALAGCGDDDGGSSDGSSGSGKSSGGSTSDCLTPAQVEHKVNEIASGFETSDAEVKQKQRQIREVRAQACP
jgi:hypothetical protein